VEAAAQPAASVSRRSPIEQRRPDPDFQATVEKVQEGLTLPVMQELNARVDLDREQPAAVATQYLQEEGYVE
jgi:glycine betaine/choline ABC-type transport system substrate-binding protein